MDDIFYPLHSFKDQFLFEPVVVNKDSLTKKRDTIVCGMGGSGTSVSLLKMLYPELSVTLHNNYGLPEIKDKDNTLVILNSYSGDTEEVLDVMKEITTTGVLFSALSCGGELIKNAGELAIPHIILPTLGIEPRFSIGHQLIGLLTLMGEEEKVAKLKEDIGTCDFASAEKDGKELTQALVGKYPVLYASKNLFPVAYLIKTAINEGSKLPCFVNVVPEANHNELQSYVSKETKKDSANFIFVFVQSPRDHARVTKRFGIMSALYNDQGYSIAKIDADHTNHTRVFELILLGLYAATYLALARGVDSYKTPFIQEFKKRLT
jgi:glucose/mannose-6-phosphate isomerase